MAALDEKKLIAEVQAGSREAFEKLLDAYEDKVFSLVSRMVGRQDAEDVAQEALIQVYKNIGGFRGKSSLGTWIYRVTVNVCLEHRRRVKPDTVGLEESCFESLPDRGPDPAAVAVRSEVKDKVGCALALLPEIHRDVVALHELQQLTYQECAEILGCPVGTVKSRLSNAFSKLRAILGDYAAESGIVK